MLKRLSVVAFRDVHAKAFRDLNLDWIEEYFFVEDLDRTHLDYPRSSFIDTGGAILVAEVNGDVVGCCGLLKHNEEVYEVSKMAVTRQLRGAGIGKILLNEVIAHAAGIGARRLSIISNTVLGPAIRLYKSVGFREIPFDSDAYERGNIALEMELRASVVN